MTAKLTLKHYLISGIAALTVAGAVFVGFDAVGAAPSAAEPVQTSGRATMRVLTADQYRNTISAIFGPEIHVQGNFPPVRRAAGGGLKAVSTTTAGVSPNDVQFYRRLATSIAMEVVEPEHRSVLITCVPANPKGADAACAEKVLGHLGSLIFRRPLTQAELTESVLLAGNSAAATSDFYSGLSFSIAQMLSSPKFLFVTEQVEPDPRNPGGTRLTSYSLASRLSMFLWNSGPSQHLIQQAAAGKLENPKERARIVNEMIASPRFEGGVRAFFTDMLALDNIANLAKDPQVYPRFNGTATADVAEQTLKLITYFVVDQNADYRDLFTTRTTFLSPNISPLYQYAAPSAAWARIEEPATSNRAGLLTQLGFLAGHAHPARSSPTLRGRAVRELLLCQRVPDPPPNIDFSILDDPRSDFKTARDRLAAHNSDPVCAGCHRLTDPIGLVLENYDGAGEYRATDGGAAIDASGELDGVPFNNAAGLGAAMRNNPATTSCLTKRVMDYALGYEMPSSDGPVYTYFENNFIKNGYKIKSLMFSIATSRVFSQVSSSPKAMRVSMVMP